MKRFSEYNPIINFMFYIGAILFGMFFVHPVFLFVSLAFAITFHVTIKGRESFRFITGLIMFACFLAAINPLINSRGEKVLFTYFGGRPYTMEALLYGFAISMMFVAVIIWFSTYNRIMTSDKFLYIFGRIAPSSSTVLTMTLRFVPNYKNKIIQLSNSRSSIGLGISGDKKQKIENALMIISSLITWAFEGGIVTADSMKSRGHGTGERTAFALYSFEAKDKALLILIIVLELITLICGIKGAAETEYTPKLHIQSTNSGYFVVGIIAYTLLLVIPTILNIMEEIRWRVSRSRI